MRHSCRKIAKCNHASSRNHSSINELVRDGQVLRKDSLEEVVSESDSPREREGVGACERMLVSLLSARKVPPARPEVHSIPSHESTASLH